MPITANDVDPDVAADDTRDEPELEYHEQIESIDKNSWNVEDDVAV